jgi:hypothetical protein
MMEENAITITIHLRQQDKLAELNEKLEDVKLKLA